MAKANNSRELNDILDYMTSILVNEFPTDVFTISHVVTSIFDTDNCHANMMIKSMISEENFDELKGIYIDLLKKNSKQTPVDIDTNKLEFDFELSKVLDEAANERKKTKGNSIGTEHILLSIINPDNNIKAKEVFNAAGIFYKDILKKCIDDSPKKPQFKSIKPRVIINGNANNTNDVVFPSKSEVNVSGVSSKHEFIEKYTININKEVENGKFDSIVGRDAEIREIIKILSRRKKNNAILVGNNGVGKSSIVYALASKINTNEVPQVLMNKEILMIDIISIVSGTHFRGMFEERVNGLFNELKASTKYILFIDDMQNVLKSNGKDKDTDISSMIGSILNDGSVKVIGTISQKEYRGTIESNTVVSSKFQKIVVEEPNKENAIAMINEIKPKYEEFHNVSYSEDAIIKSVELAKRYVTDRCLPDSAIDIIDLAGAASSVNQEDSDGIMKLKKRLAEIDEEKNAAVNSGEFELIDALNIEENTINKKLSDYKREKTKESQNPTIIEVDKISDIVSEITNIPVSKLTLSEKKKYASIDKVLKQSVIGQDEAIDSLCKVIKRNKAGLGRKNGTIGNFLLCGKSGTGKTLAAKKLAKEIFGDEKALIRLDMSEYSDKSSVTKLNGSSPGYVGYENGGQLTEAVKNKPYSVILLDEIEKADKSVYNMFLQLFDEGRLTDNAGQTVNFKNTIVIMTSNIGARQASELGNGVGFSSDKSANQKAIIEKTLKRNFAPEFLNRIDKIIQFNELTDDNLKDIIKLEINKLNEKLKELSFTFEYNDDVLNYLHKKAIDQKEYGARPIIRLIQENIEDLLTDMILDNDYDNGHEFNASIVDNKIYIV